MDERSAMSESTSDVKCSLLEALVSQRHTLTDIISKLLPSDETHHTTVRAIKHQQLLKNSKNNVFD